MKKVILVIFLALITGSLSAQTPFNFGASIGYNAPSGKFGDVYKGGIAGDVTIFYSTPAPGLDLTLRVGYGQYKYKNDFFVEQVRTNFSGYTTDFNPDWKLTDVPVMVGGKLRFPVPGVDPYITGELGLHMLKFENRFKEGSSNTSASNPLQINLNSASESASETAFGFAIGGGMEFPIVPKVGFDIGVKMNYLATTFSKKYTIVRNSNSFFTSDELKNPLYFTGKIGLTIHL